MDVRQAVCPPDGLNGECSPSSEPCAGSCAIGLPIERSRDVGSESQPFSVELAERMPMAVGD